MWSITTLLEVLCYAVVLYVMHQQDRLLLSQLRLTFPSSMDGVRNQNHSKWPHPLELNN